MPRSKSQVRAEEKSQGSGQRKEQQLRSKETEPANQEQLRVYKGGKVDKRE